MVESRMMNFSFSLLLFLHKNKNFGHWQKYHQLWIFQLILFQRLTETEKETLVDRYSGLNIHNFSIILLNKKWCLRETENFSSQINFLITFPGDS